MKKLIGLFLIVGIIFFMAGCDGTENVVLNNMSDLRVNFFEGKNSNFYVNVSCGYREEVFAYDGVSTNPVECGVITLGFFDDCSYSSVMVVLEVDGKNNEYVLERSPYENVYMEDIGYLIKSNSKVSVGLKNQQDKVLLECVSLDWEVDYKKAVKIGTNYFKDQITELYFNNTLHAECYLKIVSKINFNNKYWYFSIVDMANKNYSLLIDVNSGEIITNQK